MTPILKIGLALVIFLLAVLFMGMRAEQVPMAADFENESCSAITVEGPEGIAAEGVVTYGPASALFEIGDYFQHYWRHFTGQLTDRHSCWSFSQRPSKF